MAQTVEEHETEKSNKRVLVLRGVFLLLLVSSFVLWAKAYAECAMGAPPALLVFGTDPYEDENDLYLRLMAVDVVQKRKLPIDQFHVLDERNKTLASFSTFEGLVSQKDLTQTQRLSVAVGLPGEEQDL